MGATAGRTTLSGEGLQHLDGHSHLLASTIPNCISYDPTYAYELAVIIQHGLERMYQRHEKVFYYITLMNENYTHPAMPEGCQDGIIKGMYLLNTTSDIKTNKLKVHLFGSGSILREVEKASELLKTKYSVDSYTWSVTSYNELYRDAMDVKRTNMLHPNDAKQTSYLQQQLAIDDAPIIAASDYVKNHSGQIAQFIDLPFTALGTDGFGRSDDRENLRNFFEVDVQHICIAALHSLVEQDLLSKQVLMQAIEDFCIDTQKINPLYL